MIEFNSNLTEVLARISAFEREVASPAPLMMVWRGILHDTVEENFAKEGRPRWRALAKRTVKAREKRGYVPIKILTQRGDLARSIEEGSDRTSAWVATSLRYAKIHQYGGEIERAAYGGTVRLRANRKGQLLRQGGVGGLAIFAKDRHKQAVSRRFETGPFKIRIRARPFFLVPSGDRDKLVSAAAQFLSQRWPK